MRNISITGGLDYSSISLPQSMWQFMPNLYRLGVNDNSYYNLVIHKYIEVCVKQIQNLYTTFKDVRNDTLDFVFIPSQTVPFEAYLRTTYGSNAITVVNNPTTGLLSYLFNFSNTNGITGYEQTWYNLDEGLTPTTYYNASELAGRYDLVVTMPSSLGAVVTEISQLIELHLPVGYTYSILIV